MSADVGDVKLPLYRQFGTEDRLILSHVLRLYQLLLNRAPDPEGLAAHAHALKDGRPFADVIVQFLMSSEFENRQHRGEAPAAELLSAIGRDAFRDVGNSEDWQELACRIEREIKDDVQARRPKLLQHLVSGPVSPDDADAYSWWADDYEPTCPDATQRSQRLLSLIMVIDHADDNAIRQTMASIHAGLGGGDIELVIVVRVSFDPKSIPECMRLLRLRQPSVKLRFVLYARGRGRAFNVGLQESSGAFVGSISPGDSVARSALPCLSREISCHPDAEIVYTDHDFLDRPGRRRDPQFKTAWDPDRISSGRPLGGLVVYRGDLLRRLGGWKNVPAGLEAFDLLLRAAEVVSPDRIRHIDRILYHEYRPYSEHDSRGQPEQDLVVQGLLADCVRAKGGRAASGLAPGAFRITYPLPTQRPLVSIIIPTRDKADLLRLCLMGLLHHTAYKEIQIIIVDNDSCESATRELFAQFQRYDNVEITLYSGGFNWGKINNSAARQAKGSILLLMNNDIEVVHDDWLHEIVGQVLRPDVGIAGPRLLYPDGTLQHGGVILTPRGAGLHAMRFAKTDDPGYREMLRLTRTVSAVTGACMAVRTSVFWEAGGIEEHHLKVSCSDIDFCLRVVDRGYRVVWTPYATLLHHELATRGRDDSPEKIRRAEREEAYMAEVWSGRLDRDPFWNASLALEEGPPRLSIPPRWFSLPE